MRKILLLCFVLTLGGCSVGAYTPILEIEGRIDLPGEAATGKNLPVVYPYRQLPWNERELVGYFGPSWSDMQGSYPDYKFNY